MTDAELICDIRQALGDPVICLEADEKQWETALKNAKRWFLAKKGVIGSKEKSMVVGEKVRFSEISPTYGVDVIVDVYFDIDPTLGGFYRDCVFGVFTDGFPVVYGPYYSGGGGGYFASSSYAQLVMSYEERRRRIGSDWDWFTMEGEDFDGNDYLILDGRCGESVNTIIKFKPRLSPEQLDVNWLKSKDFLLVKHYALAEIKGMIGQIRSKYSSYETPGGSVSLNGEALLNEAKEEKELLETRIADSQGAMPFLTA